LLLVKPAIDYSIKKPMKKPFLILLCFVFSVQILKAQETNEKAVDSLYREDQFYAGVSYNLLGEKPDNLSQNGFSLGFHLGFIKDMPLNANRNMAIGIGLGYSANTFNQNLLIDKGGSGNILFSVIDENTTAFSRNRFSQHLLELPIEFRWRTSTPTEYKFWRIYTGFKLGYVFANSTKFKGELGDINNKNIDTFNDFQYGLTLSIGYNTWNLYLYYALNPIFSSDVKLDGQSIDMNAIKIGLMFYIL
jgi:Outer membrane protein beta-barrel domain